MMLTGARPSIFLSRSRIGRRCFSYGSTLLHVVDGQHDHGFDTRLTDPLGHDELGRREPDVVRIGELVEMREAIAVGGRRGGRETGQDKHNAAERRSEHEEDLRWC